MKALSCERDFILDPTLQFYLPLWRKEGAAFRSDDQHCHVCTKTGTLWQPQGHYFDGVDDKITVPDAPSLALSSSGITILAWVYARSLTGHTSSSYQIVCKYTWPDNGYSLYIYNTRLRLATGDGDWNQVGGATVVSINSWHHVAGVSDGSLLHLYLDGELDCTPAASGTLTNNTGALGIGLESGYSADYIWEGSIGEVAVYSRPFTALEIRNHYEATRWRYQ